MGRHSATRAVEMECGGRGWLLSWTEQIVRRCKPSFWGQQKIFGKCLTSNPVSGSSSHNSCIKNLIWPHLYLVKSLAIPVIHTLRVHIQEQYTYLYYITQESVSNYGCISDQVGRKDSPWQAVEEISIFWSRLSFAMSFPSKLSKDLHRISPWWDHMRKMIISVQ